MRSCTTANVERFTPGILSLLRTSAELIKSSGVTTTSTPTWEVFTSKKAQQQAQREFDHLTHLGIAGRLVGRAEALEMEPSLRHKVKAVVELGEDFGLDPLELWQYLRNAHPNVRFHTDEKVTGITRAGNDYRVTTGGGLHITATNIVIAAGVWSREIGKMLGINIPLLAAKGYSVTVPMGGPAYAQHRSSNYPNSLHPMIFADEKTATDPLGDQLRISARLNSPIPTTARSTRSECATFISEWQPLLKPYLPCPRILRNCHHGLGCDQRVLTAHPTLAPYQISRASTLRPDME